MVRRRSLTLLVALLAVSGLVPAARSAWRAPRPPLDPVLARQLKSADAGSQLLVLVHAADVRSARDAVKTHSLKQIDAFPRIGVAVAVGTPKQISSLRSDRRVTHVEADPGIRFTLDTSNVATREKELFEGFTATTTEAQPDRCTTTRKKVRNESGHGFHWENVTTCEPQPPVTVEKNIQSDGSGVSVAVIDTGVDGTHPFFQQGDKSKVVRNMKAACVSSLSLCPEDNDLGPNPWIDVTSAYNDTDTGSFGGHGTHVSGIIGGYQVSGPEGQDLHGTAPGAKILGFSVAQPSPFYAATAALNWILDNHRAPCGTAVDVADCPPIKVVNNSYGPAYTGSDLNFDPNSATAKLQRALVGEGVVVVWAAGNGSADNVGGDGSDNRVNPPAQDPTPGIIGVANYDDGNTGGRDNAIDPSSSRGKADSPETFPDIAAPGTNILSSCRTYQAICHEGGDFNPMHIDYKNASGTSMASPTIAGIVAQLFEIAPSATPEQIELALVDSAHRFAAGAPYVADTRNDKSTTLTSFDKGHGLVDVVAAASKLANMTGPDAKSECTPDGPVVVDAADDAYNILGSPAPMPSEPQLDVLEGRVAWDAVSETATFTIKVKDLTEEDPPGTVGLVFDYNFTYDSQDYDLSAERNSVDGNAFSLQQLAPTRTIRAGGLEGDFDPATDLVTVKLPNSKLGGTTTVKPFAKDDVLSNFSITSRRNGYLVVPDADTGPGTCPFTLGLGAVPPPVVEEPPPPPPPPGDVPTVFFLHHTAPAECGTDDVQTMDRTDSTGDCDGWGPIEPGAVTEPHVTSYPSTVAAGVDLPAGAKVTGTIYIESDAPGDVQVTATLKNGTVVVGQGTSDPVFQTGVEGFTPVLIGWTFKYTAIPFTFTTDEPISASDVLTLDVGLKGVPNWYFGYEADHASQFKIEAAVVPGA
jgi:subtilisin family serine protease